MTGDMNLFICLVFYLCFRIEAYYLKRPGSLLSLQQPALQPLMIWKRIQIVDYNTPIYKTKTGLSWPMIQSPRIIFWPVFLQIEDLNLPSSSSEENYRFSGIYDQFKKIFIIRDVGKYN